MATSPNSTQITPPRVPIIDERTGAVSREWYRWFYSLYNLVGNGVGVIPVASGGTGLSTIPTNGQLLIGNGTGYTLNTLGVNAGISVTNGLGTITVANTGVLSNIAGTGISVSSATGNVTVANTGVLSNIAGTGISVSSSTGNVTVANTGVLSIVAGSGISASSSTGNVTVTNTGVLSFSGSTTGLTPATATTGAVTLAGTLIAVNGGTGFNSYAVGDLLYASTTTTLAKLSDVATGNALISGGVNTAPAWGKIGLTTHVSGTLAVGNGGTGAVTLTGYVKGNGTSAFTASATIPNTDITGLGTISVKNTGASGSFTTVDLKTVTVTDGIITSIV